MILGTPAITMTLATLETRRLGDGILHQLRADRQARHASAHCVEILGLQPLEQESDRAWIFDHFETERLGDQSEVMSS